jgi:dimethylargininase
LRRGDIIAARFFPNQLCYGFIPVPIIAITREVSPNLNRCELSFHDRELIDIGRAVVQHNDYRNCLARLGAHIVSLPAEPAYPDSVFVEDAAVVFDEVAVITRIGTASRRDEGSSLVPTLSQYRPVKFLNDPATLDGGDVLPIGNRIYVGSSRRTNREGIRQLEQILQPYGCDVRPVEVRGCLHLKSACSFIGNNSLLINRSLVDPAPFHSFGCIDVAPDEPAAANTLTLNDLVLMPNSFPLTRDLLEQRGFRVQTIDVSELQKAEAGVTCCSLIFHTNA